MIEQNRIPSVRADFAVHAVDGTRATLDRALGDLADLRPEGLDALSNWMMHVRATLPPDEWATVVAERIRPHPIVSSLREEPLTARAFHKPRGYAGDAVMLDLMYAEGAAVVPTTELGKRLHLWIVRRPASLSVQYRRGLLAGLLDETALRSPRPRVLAVAAGHLREASRSYAMRCGAIDELVAFDQDQLSLDAVRTMYADLPITTRRGSVRHILSGAVGEEFDLVYSAGLYDYLSNTLAEALTDALFRRVKPGGRLLLANFAPSLADIGYMDAVMDWRLIYRDEAAMRALASTISPLDIAHLHTYRDPHGNVVYLELTRAPNASS